LDLLDFLVEPQGSGVLRRGGDEENVDDLR
jgi:hypothetical protein